MIGAKGISALRLSLDPDVRHKTAFVLAHKLREAMGAEMKDRMLSGHVEIDGAYFGGYVMPRNVKAERVDRRRSEHRSGKRRAVVIVRERKGRSPAFVFPREDDAAPTIAARATAGSTVYADEDCCTNQAESFFSRLRRMEVGTHHHVSGPYLHSYATEAAWREDNRRKPNGALYEVVPENRTGC